MWTNYLPRGSCIVTILEKRLRLFVKTKFKQTNTDIKRIYNKFIAFKIMLSYIFGPSK